jgi:hypothetical protein
MLWQWMARIDCLSFLCQNSIAGLLDAARTALLHFSRVFGEKSAKIGAAGSLTPESKLHARRV